MTEHPRPCALRLLTAGIFTACWLLQILDVVVQNDHFDRLSRARQILRYRDAPFRDFFDPGYLLTLQSSAAVQAVFGDNLLGDVLFETALIALGFALTFRLAVRASRSVSLGLAFAAFAVAAAPRLYDFDKVWFFALGLALCWHYIDRPTVGRVVLLGAGAAVGALFRYDTGVYLTCAAVVTILGCHWSQRAQRGTMSARLAVYLGALGVVLLPFLVVVHLQAGLSTSVRQIAAYAQREGLRTGIVRPPSFVVDLSGPLVVVRPPGGASVQVRWSPEVTSESRAEIEARYRLTLGTVHEGRTWAYDLNDVSPANISALILDPRVEDTAGLDRGLLRIDAAVEAAQRAWGHVPLFRMSILPGVLNIPNATAWLYYLVIALPITAVALSATRWRRHRDLPGGREAHVRMWSIAGLSLVASLSILRDPIAARIAGVVIPAVLVTACLAGEHRRDRDGASAARETSRGGAPVDRGWLLRRTAGATAGGLMVLLTCLSLLAITNWQWRVVRLGLPAGPRAVVARGREVVDALQQTPPGATLLEAGRTHALAGYLRACTKPADRVLATWFAPELYFLAGRGFAGGMVVFFGGHWSEPRDQQSIIDTIGHQSVPLVVVQDRAYADFQHSYGLVDEYLRTHYRVGGESSFGDPEAGASGYRILVSRSAAPASADDRWGMPCFP